ncbi:MAG: tetratricopeptide repeat protein [Akkermansiaceae bacterium]
MKFVITIFALITIALCIGIQDARAQEPSPQNKAAANTGGETLKRFMAMPEDTRKLFNRNLYEAQKLFQQKRLFDALQVLDALDKIFQGHPGALTLKAGCYVEMRAFEKAYPIFEQVLKINPQSTNIRFNLAELDFVMKNWEAAHQKFSELIGMLPPESKGMMQLCEFKMLLCKLKTNRVEEARAMENKYGEWDDTPYYYYATAALLYFDGKTDEAKKTLRNALFVWRDKNLLSSWQDTLIEFGYVRSFYGGQDAFESATEQVAEDDLAPAEPKIAPIIPLDTE